MLVRSIHGFNGSVKYQFNERKKLRLETFFSDYSEDLDFVADIKRRSNGTLNFTADTASDNKLRRLHTQNLNFETKGDDWSWKNAISFAQHFDEKDRWRITSKSSALMESLEDEDQKNTEAVFRSDFLKQFSFGHRLKAGIRASGLWRDYSRFVYERVAGRKFWDDITDGSYKLYEYRLGAYVSDEMRLGNLFLFPSVRLDYDARSFETADQSGEFQYTSLNSSLHAKYGITKEFSIKADVARQISRPPARSAAARRRA